MNESNLSIAKRSVKGVFALASRSLFLNLISFAAFLVVTSVLPARDIGVYTAVVAIQRIISFFTDFGLGASLIQKKDELHPEDIKSVFTIQFLLTLSIFIIVLILLQPIAATFRLQTDASYLLLVLTFTIFLSSFKIIPSIMLERTIQFERLIIPQIVESIVFNGALVIALLQGNGLSSYSIAFFISSLLGIPAYYYISPWKIEFGISSHALHHLKFGSQFQAKNILATLKDDLLTIFLSRVMTYAELGYIGFAQRIAFFTYRYIVDSVTKVTFTAYSRLQEDKKYLQLAIEKSLFFVSSVMFPTLLGLTVVMPYLIDFYPKWNNKWEAAVISVVFFCLNASISSLSGILVNVLDANGKVKVTLQLMIIWTTLTWTLTPLLLKLYGYNGVAAASFIVTLTIFYTVYLVKKIVPFNFWKNIYQPLLSSVLMVTIVYVSAKLIARDILSLLLVIALGGVVYIGIMYLLAGKKIRADLSKFGIKL